MSGFVRNSVLGMVAGLSTMLTNFITGLIVARLLGADGLGTFAFTGWLASIVMIAVSFGLPFTLTRFLPELLDREGTAAARGLAASLAVPVLAATLSILAVACLTGFIDYAYLGETLVNIPGRSYFRDPVLCVLIGLCASSQALAEYARSYLKGTHQFSRVAFITLISAGLQIAAIAAGGYLFGVRGAIAGSVASAIYPIVVFREFTRHQTQTTPDLRSRISRYTKFRWGSELLNFFVWSRIEVFFLLIFWSASSVGLFTTSLALANLASQGPLMLTGSLLPHLSRKFSQKDLAAVHKTYETGTRLMAFMACPMCIGLAAIMPRIVPVLYGSTFAGAVPSAIILVFAASLTAPSSIGSNLLLAAERNDVDFYLGILGAILSGLGAILLIRPFGILGAALSRAITQVVCVALSSIFLKTRMNVKIPLGSIGKILLSGLLCAGAAHVTLQMLPGISGMVLAVTAGASVYAAAIRLSRALETEDIAQLGQALQILPRPLAGTSRKFLIFLDSRTASVTQP